MDVAKGDRTQGGVRVKEEDAVFEYDTDCCTDHQSDQTEGVVRVKREDADFEYDTDCT